MSRISDTLRGEIAILGCRPASPTYQEISIAAPLCHLAGGPVSREPLGAKQKNAHVAVGLVGDEALVVLLVFYSKASAPVTVSE